MRNSELLEIKNISDVINGFVRDNSSDNGKVQTGFEALRAANMPEVLARAISSSLDPLNPNLPFALFTKIQKPSFNASFENFFYGLYDYRGIPDKYLHSIPNMSAVVAGGYILYYIPKPLGIKAKTDPDIGGIETDSDFDGERESKHCNPKSHPIYLPYEKLFKQAIMAAGQSNSLYFIGAWSPLDEKYKALEYFVITSKFTKQVSFNRPIFFDKKVNEKYECYENDPNGYNVDIKELREHLINSKDLCYSAACKLKLKWENQFPADNSLVGTDGHQKTRRKPQAPYLFMTFYKNINLPSNNTKIGFLHQGLFYSTASTGVLTADIDLVTATKLEETIHHDVSSFGESSHNLFNIIGQHDTDQGKYFKLLNDNVKDYLGGKKTTGRTLENSAFTGCISACGRIHMGAISSSSYTYACLFSYLLRC